MHELIIYGNPGGRTLKRYTLRQGLDPALDTDQVETYLGAAPTSGNFSSMAVTPDGTKLVAAIGGAATSNQFWIWPDTNDKTNFVQPVATFGGQVQAVAASNSFCVIGGASPFLYVFDWATLSLVSVSTTGLGAVSGLAFNADGSKLAVAHLASPYLRLYNTSDWTYVDAAVSAGAGRANVAYSTDGTVIMTTGTSSPYVTTFDVTLATRIFQSTNSTYYGGLGSGIKANPLKPKAFVAWVGGQTSTSYTKLYEFDAAANTFTAIIPTSAAVSVYAAEFDVQNNKMYTISTSYNGSILNSFNATTYALDASPPNQMNLLTQGSNCVMTKIKRDVGKISGTVRDVSNNPVARDVIAYDRGTRRAVGKVTSDGTTGNYTMNLPTQNVVDVQFKIASGELLNDLFYARAQPDTA